MASDCKTCNGTGFFKAQRAEMLCPDCLRIGDGPAEWTPERLAVRTRIPVRRTEDVSHERTVDLTGGEIYD